MVPTLWDDNPRTKDPETARHSIIPMLADQEQRLKRWMLFLAALWTVAIGYSLYWGAALPMLPDVGWRHRPYATLAISQVLLWLVGLGCLGLYFRGASAVSRSRRLTEEALRQGEERLRLALEGATDGIWDWDLRSGAVYFSPQYYRMLGYEPDEFPASYDNWLGLLHPGDRAAAEAAVRGHIAAGSGNFAIEFRMRAKNGDWRWILGRGKVVQRDGAGRPIRVAGSHSDVGERKRMQDALREREAYLKAIIENEPECVKLLDRQSRLLDMNPAGLAMLEADSLERLVGRELLPIVDANDRDRFCEALAAVFRGEKQTLNFRARTIKGNERWFETYAVPLWSTGEPRQVSACLGVTRDVTEAKRREDALLFSQFALDNAPDGIFWMNEDGSVAYANAQACRELGYSREELVGKPVWELDPELPAELWRQQWEAVRSAGAQTFERRHRRKDGSMHPVEISSVHMERDHVAMRVAFVRDISDRKRAIEALRQEKHFSDAVLNSLPGVVYILDDQGRVRRWNTNLERITGFEAAELQAMQATAFVVAADRPRLAAKFRETLELGESFVEATLQTRRGQTIAYFFTAVRMLEGDRRYLVGAGIDISERKAAEEALKALNANLEARVRDEVAKNREKDHLMTQQARLAAMGEMIGNIAHQWRQPINALSLVLANLKDAHAYGTLDASYLTRQVDLGVQLIQKMSTTIDDFRNFFRAHRTPQVFSLEAAVRGAMAIIEPSYAHADIALELEVIGDARLLGFPNEYSQVVLNLLGNAKDAIQERRILHGRVSVRIDHDADEATLIIADNGGGIPTEVLPRIFDPYFTTRDQGTGIGLYMSKVIIEANMGGRIEVANVGSGACIRLVVPLLPAGQDTATGVEP